jgi:ABC-type branched-subunit amino acid transport system substrate-binding protein
MGFSHWKVIAAAVAGLLLAAACGGSSNTASTGPTKVQVAFEFMFTPSNVPGDAMLKAAQLYIKQFNDKGGIKGTKVDLVVWDDQGKGAIAQTLQAQGISDPTVLGLICCQFSSVTLASEPGLQGATPPLPFVAIGASNPKVTDSGYSVAHRINARDDLQGPADAKFIVDKGAKRFEILYPNIDYGTLWLTRLRSTSRPTAPASRRSATRSRSASGTSAPSSRISRPSIPTGSFRPASRNHPRQRFRLSARAPHGQSTQSLLRGHSWFPSRSR